MAHRLPEEAVEGIVAHAREMYTRLGLLLVHWMFCLVTSFNQIIIGSSTVDEKNLHRDRHTSYHVQS
jgi:hypothetical protein